MKMTCDEAKIANIVYLTREETKIPKGYNFFLAHPEYQAALHHNPLVACCLHDSRRWLVKPRSHLY